MASPSGDIYATQLQLNRLEDIVHKQQFIIDNLQLDKLFLTTELSKHIDEQVDDAMRRRGSIGSEYMNIAKFISKQIAQGMLQIQIHASKCVEQSIPMKILQDLEKRYMTKPCVSMDISSLANRISHLESKFHNKSNIANGNETQNTSTIDNLDVNETHVTSTDKCIEISKDAIKQQIDEIIQSSELTEEINKLKEHINYLEKTLLNEVQKAYKSSTKPGEYAVPLTKLQSQVDVLQQDVNRMKSFDGQAIAESLLNTTLSNFKSEVKQQFELCASIYDVDKIKSDMIRVETFAREVQTGYHDAKIKQEKILDEVTQYIITNNTESQTKLKNDIETLIEKTIDEPKRTFKTLNENTQNLISKLENLGLRLDKDFRNHYSPEKLANYIQDIQSGISTKNDEFQKNLELSIGLKFDMEMDAIKRLQNFIITKEFNQIRQEQSDFISKINSDTNVENLKKLYDNFTSELEKQTIYFNKLNEEFRGINEIQNEFETRVKEIKSAEISILEIQDSIEKSKIHFTKELEKWFDENKDEFNLKFNIFNKQILELTDFFKNEQEETRVRISKEYDLLKQNFEEMNVHFEKEREIQKEKYIDFEKTIFSRFEKWLFDRTESWLAERTKMISGRMLEINQQAKEVIDMINARHILFDNMCNESKIKEFVVECERRLKVSQDNWMQRRTEEFHTKYSDIDRNIILIKNMFRDAELNTENQKNLKYDIEMLLCKIISEPKRVYDMANENVKKIIEKLENIGDKLDKDIRSQYSPEMIDKHVSEIYNTIISKYSQFEENINHKLISKINTELEQSKDANHTIMMKELSDMRQEQTTFINRINTETDLTYLKNSCALFTIELQKQNNIFTNLREEYCNLDTIQSQFQERVKHIKHTEELLNDIKGFVNDTKNVIILELDQWLLNNKTHLDHKIRDIESEVQNVKNCYNLLQIEFKNQFTNEIHEYQDKYRELKRILETETLKQKESLIQLQTNLDIWAENNKSLFINKLLVFDQNILEIRKNYSELQNELTNKFTMEQNNFKHVFNTLREEFTKQFDSEKDKYIELEKITDELYKTHKTSFEKKIKDMNNDVNDMKNNFTSMQLEIRTKFEDDQRLQRERYLELQSYLDEERSRQKEKYLELQKSIFSNFENWLSERMEYWLGERSKVLSLRMVEINQQVRDIIEQANKREKELSLLYNENTIRQFVMECEKRLKISQDSWMQRRTEELQNKFFDIERNINMIKNIAKDVESREARMNENYSENAMAKIISQIDMKLIAFQAMMKEQENSGDKRERFYTGLTKCFYTAIFAKPGQNIDTLAPIPYKIPGWKYICFTNTKIENSDGWHIINVSLSYTTTNPKVEAKKYKWLSHEYLSDFDVVVWVDAYIAPNPMYNELLKQWILNMADTNTLITHRPHEERNCVYQECDAIIKYKRDSPTNVEKARQMLEESNIPKHGGLFDTNILIKFHKNSKVQEVCEEIFKYLHTVSYRDQIIVPYVYHKLEFKDYQEQQLLRAFSKSGTHVRIPV